MPVTPSYAVKQGHHDQPYTLVGIYADATAAVRAAHDSARQNGQGCYIDHPGGTATVYPEGDHKGCYGGVLHDALWAMSARVAGAQVSL